MKAPVLETTRLILEPLSTRYASNDYVCWMNDPEVIKFLESGGDYTVDSLKDFLIDVEKKDIYFWAISIKSRHKHIGNIKIDPINQRHGIGEYGIMMGDKSEWGKGYAKEASRMVLDFCFNQLKLRKITLGVVKDNVSAVELYKKLGFVIEGVYKMHGLYDGKYCDDYRMALFAK